MKHMAREVGIGRWGEKYGKWDIFPSLGGGEHDLPDLRTSVDHS